MARIKTDSNLYDIEKRLGEVMAICEKEHDEKIELKAENYDLKKKLDNTIKKLDRQISSLEAKGGSSLEVGQNLTSKQRAMLEKTKELRADIVEFAKKIDSVAYSIDIKNRNNK